MLNAGVSGVIGGDPAAVHPGRERARCQCSAQRSAHQRPRRRAGSGADHPGEQARQFGHPACQMPVPKHISSRRSSTPSARRRTWTRSSVNVGRSWLAFRFLCRARPRVSWSCSTSTRSTRRQGGSRSQSLRLSASRRACCRAAPSRHGYHLPQPHAGSCRGVPPCGYSVAAVGKVQALLRRIWSRRRRQS